MKCEIGTGYQKQTGWIGANDGFLVLDRNFNNSVGNGVELLSNSLAADPAKGLRSVTARGLTAIHFRHIGYEFNGKSGNHGEGYSSILTQTLEAQDESLLYVAVGASIKVDAPDGTPEILIVQNHSEVAHRTLKSANEPWRQAA